VATEAEESPELKVKRAVVIEAEEEAASDTRETTMENKIRTTTR
jgi:hypothetical protein